MVIPERVWQLLSDGEADDLRAFINGVMRPTFTCPGCGAEVSVRVKLTFASPVIVSEAQPKTPKAEVLARSSVDKRVIEAAQTSGLMAAFIATVKAEKEHSGTPSDFEEFFLQFWKHAVVIAVPRIVLAQWIDEFGGSIEVLNYQGVLAILSDGALMAFYPKRLTIPTTTSGVLAKVSNAGSFEMWRKGRFGYVPMGAREFGQALRQKNIGKFGAVVQ